MSLYATVPLAIGQKSSSGVLAPLVGIEIEVPSASVGVTGTTGISTVKLVKAAATFASCDGKAVLWTASDLNTVGAVAGAVAVSSTVAGIAYITPSGATGVTSGDYFWVVVRGPALASASAAYAVNVLLATAASGNVSGTLTATDGSTVIGRSLALAAGAGASTIFVKIV